MEFKIGAGMSLGFGVKPASNNIDYAYKARVFSESMRTNPGNSKRNAERKFSSLTIEK